MTPPTTEARLRATLAAIANQVEPDPEAYPRATTAWRRRKRRRRLLVALLATIIIAVDVAIGSGHPTTPGAPPRPRSR
jgi:hypothetical protein